MDKQRKTAGFTLLEVLMVMAIGLLIILFYAKSMSNNLHARKELTSKLGYQEASLSVRSFLRKVLLNPPANGCLNFTNIKEATIASNLMYVDDQLDSGLTSQQANQLELSRNKVAKDVIERCRTQQAPLNDCNPSDSCLHLCTRFHQQNNGSENGLLSSSHVFAEFKFEYVDSHTGQPISCVEYANSQQAAVNVYYGLYWSNGQSGETSYSKYLGYYYVGK